MCQRVPGKSRKHPAIAVSTSGDTLVVWAEGTGWQRGGDLARQVFDKNGKATDQHGRALRGIPVWGLPTAVAHGRRLRHHSLIARPDSATAPIGSSLRFAAGRRPATALYASVNRSRLHS